MASRLLDIPLDEICVDDEFNCRGKINMLSVAELAKDIKSNGLIQSIVVALTPQEDLVRYGGKKYRLIAGFRRVKAHLILREDDGRQVISAIINDSLISETDMVLANLSENLHREALDIGQEANTLRKLYSLGLTEETIAERVSKSRGWVQVRTMFIKLPEQVQNEIVINKIPQTDIRSLYTVYVRLGLEKLEEALRNVKDAKLLGKKSKPLNKDNKRTQKKLKTRQEIFIMQEAIRVSFGASVLTRAMAWAAGAISTTEFIEDLEKHGESLGLMFEEPENL